MSRDDRADLPFGATTILGATVIGAVGGSLVTVLCGWLSAALSAPEAGGPTPAAIVATLFEAMLYALFASPIVLGGLLIFGLPALYALKPYHQEFWLWPLSALLGAVCSYIAVQLTGFFSSGGFHRLNVAPIAFLIYGACSGMALCFTAKRHLAGRDV